MSWQNTLKDELDRAMTEFIEQYGDDGGIESLLEIVGAVIQEYYNKKSCCNCQG